MFTRANWSFTWIDKGGSFDYVQDAPMSNANAEMFKTFWDEELTPTVPAECTVSLSRYDADRQLVTILSPGLADMTDGHEAVMTDVKTVQDALVTRTADVATANAAAATFAAALPIAAVARE